MDLEPSAYLLDISRTLRRTVRATGIDRVERAYARHLARLEGVVFFLARLPGGYGLFDRALFASAAGAPAAVARCGRFGLARMLRSHLPAGFEYLNVGHSNLGNAVFRAVRRGGAGRISAMVHDMIPLDCPQFTRRGVPAGFCRKMQSVRAHCDRVIYNSKATKLSAEARFAGWGRPPPGVVAHLGFDPVPSGCQTDLAEMRHFVALGTIEPRKNHALLLDIWEEFGATLPPDRIPHLYIVGRRGWMNGDVFARLDAAARPGRRVHELGALPDNEVRHLLGGAGALLFPSLAEGFGLPVGEALQLGTPAICSDLPVLREVYGDYPLYVQPKDRASWVKSILMLANPKNMPHDSCRRRRLAPLPAWDDHFAQVFGNKNKCVSGHGRQATDGEAGTAGIFPATGTQAKTASCDPQEPRTAFAARPDAADFPG
ncbi:MAG: glycosyltransferase family 4 protein [Paracoccaceae bacterium]